MKIGMVFGHGPSRRGADPVTDEAILAAATSLLVERGWAKFDVAGVARAAGVSRGTLHRRFENRTEILRALIERDARGRVQIGLRWLEDLATTDDLARSVRGVVSLLIGNRRSQPATAILRRAALTTPGLISVDDGWHADWIPPLANALRRRYRRLSPHRATIAARFIATMHVFVIDLALTHPDAETAILREWEPLLVGYFTRLGRPDADAESDENPGS